MYPKKYTVLLLFLFIFINGYAQTVTLEELMGTEFKALVINNPEKLIKGLDSLLLIENRNVSKAEVYLLKGQAYYVLNQPVNANLSLKKAITFAKKNNELNFEAQAYIIQASVQDMLDNFDKSDTYLNLALPIFKQIKDTIGIIGVYQSKAVNLINQEKYQESNFILLNKQFLQLLETDIESYMITCFYITTNYLGLNQLKKAQEYANKLYDKELEKKIKKLSEVELANYNYYKNATIMSFAGYYIENKEADAALSQLSQINKTLINSDLYMKKEYFEDYVSIYQQKSNISLAKKYTDSLTTLTDQLLKQQIDNNMLLVDDNHNLSTTLTQKEHLKNKYLYFLIFSLATSLLLIVFIKQMRKKQQGKLLEKTKENIQISLKSDKLKQSKLHIQSVNQKFTENIDYSLSDILKEKDTQERRKKTQLLKNEIHTKKVAENDMNTYNNLHAITPLFFKTVKQNHPSLTEDDLVICYYLHIELNNKQISEILHKTIRSIESKRYRIGKKMNLNVKKTTLLDEINKCF